MDGMFSDVNGMFGNIGEKAIPELKEMSVLIDELTKKANEAGKSIESSLGKFNSSGNASKMFSEIESQLKNVSDALNIVTAKRKELMADKKTNGDSWSSEQLKAYHDQNIEITKVKISLESLKTAYKQTSNEISEIIKRSAEMTDAQRKAAEASAKAHAEQVKSNPVSSTNKNLSETFEKISGKSGAELKAMESSLGAIREQADNTGKSLSSVVGTFNSSDSATAYLESVKNGLKEINDIRKNVETARSSVEEQRKGVSRTSAEGKELGDQRSALAHISVTLRSVQDAYAQMEKELEAIISRSKDMTVEQRASAEAEKIAAEEAKKANDAKAESIEKVAEAQSKTTDNQPSQAATVEPQAETTTTADVAKVAESKQELAQASEQVINAVEAEAQANESVSISEANAVSSTQAEVQYLEASTEAHAEHADAVSRDAEAQASMADTPKPVEVPMNMGAEADASKAVSAEEAVRSAVEGVAEAKDKITQATNENLEAAKAVASAETSNTSNINSQKASLEAELTSLKEELSAYRALRAQSEQFVKDAEASGNTQAFNSHTKDVEELTNKINGLLAKIADVNHQLNSLQSSGQYKKLGDFMPDVAAGAVKQKAEKEALEQKVRAKSAGEYIKKDFEMWDKEQKQKHNPNARYDENSQKESQIVPEIRSVEELNRKIVELQEKIDAIRAKSAPGGIIDVEKNAQEIGQLNSEMNNLLRMRDAIQPRPIIQNKEAEFTSLQELEARINAVKSMIADTRSAQQNGGLVDVTKSAQDIQILEEERKRLEGMRKQFDAPKNEGPEFYESINSAQQLEGVIQQLKEKIDQTRANLQNGKSADWETDVVKLRDYEKALKELLGVKKTVDGQQDTNQQPLMNYSQLLDAIKEKKREIVNAKWELANSVDVQGDVDRIRTLENELKKLQQAKSMYQQSTPGGMLSGMLSNIGHGLKDKMISAVKGVIPGTIGLLKSAFSGLVSATIGIGKGMFNGLISGSKIATHAIGALAKGGFGALTKGVSAGVKGIKNLVGHVTSFAKKHSPHLLKSLKSIKSMLVRRLKRTFISAIFNQAKQGLQGLALYSEQFNQAMSNIKNTSKETAGNLAVSLGSLLEKIEPVLETLLGWLNTILKAFNSFIALISGKSTVTVAKKSTDDYAKSLKKASGAAKELNNQLYGFDELTRQEDNNGSGSGSGSASSQYAQFEEQEIESVIGSNLKDTFQAIIDSFKNGEFFHAGELIGGLFNDLVSTLDDKVNELHTKAVGWAKNIAQTLNGIVATIDFGKVGKLVGDSLNTITDTLHTFLTTFDFGALGKGFAEMFNGSTFDWGLLGTTIADGIDGIFHFVDEYVSNLDFNKLGNNISSFITNMFSTMDLESASHALSTGINGALTSFTNIVSTVKWGEIASNISTKLWNTINNVNWTGEGSVSELLTKSVNSVVDIFWNIIPDDKTVGEIASKLGAAVGDFISGIDWNKIMDTIREGRNKIGLVFKNFVAELKLKAVAKNFADGINNNLLSGDSKKKFEEFTENISGGLNDIIDAFGTLVSNIDFAGIGEELGSRIQLMLLTINWDELVTHIGKGAIKLTTAFSNLVAKVFETTIDPVTGEKTNIGKKLANALNEIFSDKQMFTELGMSLGNGIHGIFESFATLIGEAKWGEILDSIFETLKTAIHQVFGRNEEGKSLGTVFAEAINNMFSSFTDENLDSIGENISTMIIDALGAIEDFIENLPLQKIVDSIVKLVSSIKWGDVIEKLISLIGSALGEVGEAIATLQLGIVRLLTKINWLDVASGIIDGIVRGISEMIGSGIDVADKVLRAILGDDLADKLWSILGGVEKIKETMGEAKSATGAFRDVLNELPGVFTGETKVTWAWESSEPDYERNMQHILNGGVPIAPSLILNKDLDGWAEIDYDRGALETAYSDFMQNEVLPIFQQIVAQQGVELDAKNFHVFYDMMTANFDKNWLNGKKDNIGIQDLWPAWETMLQEFADQHGVTFVPTVHIPAVQMSNEEIENALNEVGTRITNLVANGKTLTTLNVNRQISETFGESARLARQSFINELVGKEKDDIQDAIMLLQAGINGDLITALNIEGLHARLEAWMQETGTSYEDIISDNVVAVRAVLSSMGTDSSEVLLNALNDANLASDLQKWMQESGASLDETIVYLMALMGQDVTEVAGTVGENVGEKLGSTIPSSLRDALHVGQAEVKKASQELTEAATQTTEQLNEIEANSKEVGKQLVGGLVSKIGEQQQSASEASGNTVNAVEEKFKALPDKVKPYATQMLEYITTAIVEGDGTVITAIEDMAKAVVASVETMLSGSKGAEITKAFLEGLKKGVTDNIETFTSQADTIGRGFVNSMVIAIATERENLVSTMDELTSFTLQTANSRMSIWNGKAIGSNLVIGMINGVNAYGQTLVDAIATICNCTVDTARDILGIESPSKVFAEIGGYMMEGMEDGINGKGQGAIDAISDIAGAIIDEGGIDLSVDAMANGLDTVESKMSRIAQIFSDIASTITDMGGFEVPTVASGKVIPYRTRIDTSAIPNSAETVLSDRNNLEDAIYSAFMRAMGNTDNQQVVKVYLDGKELTDSVNKYQRQQARAWGV